MKMKFFSYTNENKNYSRAISLQNIRTVTAKESTGKSACRFFIEFDYVDDKIEYLNYLHQEEAEQVFKNIVSALNDPS